MRSALAEVAKHSDNQKFKREHPDSAYKNVKSKLAGNIKSIEKAKKRDKRNKEAEDNPSPVEISIREIFERKIASASPLKSSSPAKSPTKSPLKHKMEEAASLRIRKIQDQIDATEFEHARLREELAVTKKAIATENQLSPTKTYTGTLSTFKVFEEQTITAVRDRTHYEVSSPELTL